MTKDKNSKKKNTKTGAKEDLGTREPNSATMPGLPTTLSVPFTVADVRNESSKCFACVCVVRLIATTHAATMDIMSVPK